MKSRIAVLAVAVAALLSGCVAAATAEPADIAALAADALQQQLDARPVVDCGGEVVPLVAGTVVPCELTDPATGDRFAAPVTIQTVQGTDVTVAVRVADAATSPSPAPAAPPASAATVPGTELAALAAGALEDALGYRPDIVCPEGEATVAVGTSLRCAFGADDQRRDVRIQIMQFDGATYRIDAAIVG